MGTPVQIRTREEQCVGAGECISRPMTEEERFKYFGEKREVKPLKGVKIEPPEKEKLLETLAEVQGKTKAVEYAAKVYAVSFSTIYTWIKEYAIQFDESGYVIREPEENMPEPEETKEIPEHEETIGTTDSVDKPSDAIGTINEEVKALPCKVAYAEYDITENLCVIVDFRQELVSINDCKEFTFEEAEAVADLLANIL